MQARHTPVMQKEVVEALNVKPSGVYVDATFGGGGHTRAILSHLGPNGRVIAFDRDPEAIAFGALNVEDKRLTLIQECFANIETTLLALNIPSVEGIVFDLGISSTQLDEARRGFSFQKKGPLDMRMNQEQGSPVWEWLAHATETEIATVIRDYGEERKSKLVARAIISERKHQKIQETDVLANIVARIVGGGPKHPATRVFQALRIFCNKELEEIKDALPCSVRMLNTGGRLCVISFHSLEDRIVKQFIKEMSQKSQLPEPYEAPKVGGFGTPLLKKLRKTRPSRDETLNNRRARSALLRIAERC